MKIKAMIKSFRFLQNAAPFITSQKSLCFINLPTQIRNMASSTSNIPIVDIDPTGVFKYILLNVHDKEKHASEPLMVLVRGYKRCNYHSDIYDEVQAKMPTLDCEPLGGGRISHDPENKKIHIYGYSQGYGKADHDITAKLLKDAYPGYTITVSDEGESKCPCK